MNTDLVGQQFGRLTIVGFESKRGWVCQCECGRRTHANRSKLTSGSAKSCGCLKTERVSRLKLRHGAARKGPARQREYRIWANAKSRCFNDRVPCFRNYGARGITMCDEWRDSFEAFLADMGPCPPKHTLERRDNDGPYAPWNCEWATRTKQARNQRTNRLLTHNGETLNVTSWAERLGMSSKTITSRLHRGLAAADALRTA